MLTSVSTMSRYGGGVSVTLLFNVSKPRETSFETSWQAFRILSVTQATGDRLHNDDCKEESTILHM